MYYLILKGIKLADNKVEKRLGWEEAGIINRKQATLYLFRLNCWHRRFKQNVRVLAATRNAAKPNLALIETNRITVKITSRQERGLSIQREKLQGIRRQDEEQAGRVTNLRVG